jgi:hypothetical protein
MTFSEFELKLIDKLVGEFCRNRVPARIQNQLRYIYRVEGQDVLIAEDRPRWGKPDEWIALDFAKLKYIRKHKIWRLYWKRASGKWELYKPYSESPNLKVLIDTIKQDQHGCFFG